MGRSDLRPVSRHARLMTAFQQFELGRSQAAAIYDDVLSVWERAGPIRQSKGKGSTIHTMVKFALESGGKRKYLTGEIQRIVESIRSISSAANAREFALELVRLATLVLSKEDVIRRSPALLGGGSDPYLTFVAPACPESRLVAVFEQLDLAIRLNAIAGAVAVLPIVLLLHPFVDGNGRVSRLLFLGIFARVAEQSGGIMERILRASVIDKWKLIETISYCRHAGSFVDYANLTRKWAAFDA